MKDTLNSPQVIAALITSTVAVILAVVPTLINNSSQPSPTSIPITEAVVEVIVPTETPTIALSPTDENNTEAQAVATDTTEPPTTTSVPPTDEPPTATSIPSTKVPPTSTPIPPTKAPPTSTPIPPTATSMPATDAPPANTLLMYDDVSFTIYNQGSQQLAISNMSFQSSSGSWDASQWGVALTDKFAVSNCLRLRDVNSGQRQPPAICGTLLGLQLTSGSTLFWLNVAEFDVLIDGSTVATCLIADESCGVFVP